MRSGNNLLNTSYKEIQEMGSSLLTGFDSVREQNLGKAFCNLKTVERELRSLCCFKEVAASTCNNVCIKVTNADLGASGLRLTSIGLKTRFCIEALYMVSKKIVHSFQYSLVFTLENS